MIFLAHPNPNDSPNCFKVARALEANTHQKLHDLEDDPSEILKSIEAAEVVNIVYPVYNYSYPSRFKHFIDNNIPRGAFKSKAIHIYRTHGMEDPSMPDSIITNLHYKIDEIDKAVFGIYGGARSVEHTHLFGCMNQESSNMQEVLGSISGK